MAAPPPQPGSGDENGARPGRTPRWVYVFGIIAFVVVVLFVVLLLTDRGGGHGPRRHLPAGEPRTQTPSPGVTQGEQQP